MIIHIMKMLKTRSITNSSLRRGFSYIEVIMAATILAIMILPVVNSFYQSAKNHKFSTIYYTAALNIQSIAEEVVNMLSDEVDINEKLEHYFENDIYNYDLESYSYHLYLSEIIDGAISSEELYFYTQDDMGSIPFDGIHYTGNSVAENNNQTIVLDGAEDNIVDVNIKYSDGQLNFSENISIDYYVNLEIKDMEDSIKIYNHSENMIFINLIEGNVEAKTKNIIVNHINYPKQDYFLTLDVYDKSNQIIIKRISRII